MGENIRFERKHYIDNLRWLCILLLIPFHGAMAWNCWGEGNYIWFEGSRRFSTFIIMISPWYMPLLFVLAGVSTRYALRKRTTREFVRERVTKLLVPLITGVVTAVAVMTYYADRFHNGYSGNFISHYSVFFTRVTDLTGYDGGITPAHLWFLLYLFIVSMICITVIMLQRKFYPGFSAKNMGKVTLFLLWILPLIVSPILNFAGKSIAAYLVLYLIGFYVISEERILDIIDKYRWPYLILMVVTVAADVYMFIFTDNANGVVNTIIHYMASYYGILTVLAFGKRYFNQNNKITGYFTSRSFLIYIFHFMWLVIFQFYLSRVTEITSVLYVVPVIGAYVMTLITCELVRKIPGIRWLYGVKVRKSKS